MDFKKCMPVILLWEGGKVDDPRDPGGRTNQGITQRVYTAYRRRKGMQQRDVYQMTPEERDDIYRTNYWNAIQGDLLPLGVDLLVMDGAVNSGVVQSVKWLQRAVGVVDDGIVGPATLHAATNYPDKQALLTLITNQREAFLRSLKTFKTFGTGWLRRTASVKQTASSWVANVPAPAPMPVSPVGVADASAKADPADVKAPPPKGVADAATGGGLSSLGLSQVINNLQQQLTPFSLASGWITKLVVALIVIGAALTIGGLAWRFYSEWKAKRIAEATK
jgi:lysozyme family protein